jgi:hypothetical protein
MSEYYFGTNDGFAGAQNELLQSALGSGTGGSEGRRGEGGNVDHASLAALIESAVSAKVEDVVHAAVERALRADREQLLARMEVLVEAKAQESAKTVTAAVAKQVEEGNRQLREMLQQALAGSS